MATNNTSDHDSGEHITHWQADHQDRGSLFHLFGWGLAITFVLPWYQVGSFGFGALGLTKKSESYFFIWEVLAKTLKEVLSEAVQSQFKTFVWIYGFVAVALIVMGFLRQKLAWRWYIYAGLAVGGVALVGLKTFENIFTNAVERSPFSFSLLNSVSIYCCLIGLSLGCDLRTRYAYTRVGPALILVAGSILLYFLLGTDAMYAGGSFLSGMWSLLTDGDIPVFGRIIVASILLIIPMTILTFLGLLPAAKNPYGPIYRVLKLLSLAILAWVPGVFVLLFMVSFFMLPTTLFVYGYIGLLLFVVMQRVEHGLAFVVETLERKYLPPTEDADA